MRYSIIHHDIREHFELSLYEYAVCDSIFQLSRRFPTTKSAREIGDFLGIDHKTVLKSENMLLFKGLVVREGDGLKTSLQWDEMVLWKRSIPQSGEISPTGDTVPRTGDTVPTYNYKEYKEHTSESEDSQGYTIEPEGEQEPRKKSKPKYPHSRKVFQLWGSYPINWNLNTTQLRAAQNLYEGRGFEQVKRAYNFYREHQGSKWIPEINTPHDLDSKWEKLLAFKNRKHELPME